MIMSLLHFTLIDYLDQDYIQGIDIVTTKEIDIIKKKGHRNAMNARIQKEPIRLHQTTKKIESRKNRILSGIQNGKQWNCRKKPISKIKKENISSMMNSKRRKKTRTQIVLRLFLQKGLLVRSAMN